MGTKLTLKEILLDISKKTKINISYQDEILKSTQKLTVKVNEKRLGTVLDQLLANHDVKYKIVGDQIVIVPDTYARVSGNHIISGYVKDADSRESLIGANVYIQDKSKGSITNDYGFYSFNLPTGRHRIYYTYLGFKRSILEFDLSRDTVIDVNLESSILLNEILITDTKIEKTDNIESTHIDEIHIPSMLSEVSLGGEPDVLRQASKLPGITSGADGFGGLSVRGGSPDQNLILVDGVPIYNPYHSLGLFSVFNSKIIKNTTIYKSAFPSRYGSRLSSVTDIWTKEGNMLKTSGDVTLSLLSAKATLEGPILKDRISYLVSFRRTIMDPWIKTFTSYQNQSQGKEGEASYNFYDFNGKINFKLGRKSNLFFSYYRGNDAFSNNVIDSEVAGDNTFLFLDELDWNWGNQLATVRFTQEINKKLFFTAAGYLTNYDFSTFNHDRDETKLGDLITNLNFSGGLYKSTVSDIGLQLHFDYYLNSFNKINYGLNIIDHKFTPGLYVGDNRSIELSEEGTFLTPEFLGEFLTNPPIKSREYQFYLEDKISFNAQNSLRIGVRLDMVKTETETFTLPQPRIEYVFEDQEYTFNASLSFMSQFLHQLTNSGLGVPSDVWLPSTDIIKPQQGWISSIGGSKKISENQVMGADLFFKNMTNVLTLSENKQFTITRDNDWQKNIPVGKGQSYGLELFYNRRMDKTNISANYTLSFATRNFEDINQGKTFNFRYDRRHAINISSVYKINFNSEFTMNWTYGSGNPISVPINIAEDVDDFGNIIYVLNYGDKNNGKLPAYHRLDMGFNFYNKFKWARQKISLGLYNAYNRSNPYFLDVSTDINLDGKEVYRLRKFNLLPIIPNFSYSLSF